MQMRSDDIEGKVLSGLVSALIALGITLGVVMYLTGHLHISLAS